MRRSILVTGRDVAFEQLRFDGDLHGAEQGITLHGGTGDSPTETFDEVDIQRIRHVPSLLYTRTTALIRARRVQQG